MERSILHVDCNNFFASVESVYDPSLKKVPCAVGGRQEERHGIILAKNELAKKYGVKTGEAIWQAEKKCPGLVIVEPHFDRYNKFSKLFKGICFEYTDLLESFGIDECWLDVTGNRFGAVEIAEKIRNRVKNEYGLTVSVGVSFNKIFAKLASDMKKPDAVTIVSRENFREKVWKLPAGDLLGVGRATLKKLDSHGVSTIGEIACCEPEILCSWFGKNGIELWRWANGMDTSEVSRFDQYIPPKSVSSGYTPYRDLVNEDDVRILIYALSENIASQLRRYEMKCKTVSINIRSSDLEHFSRQCHIESTFPDSAQIAESAMKLFMREYAEGGKIRSLSVCAADLVPYTEYVQLDFSGETQKALRSAKLSRAVDLIRRRYGYDSVHRAVLMQDPGLGMFDPKEVGDAHPVGIH